MLLYSNNLEMINKILGVLSIEASVVKSVLLSSKLEAPSSQHFARPKNHLMKHAFLELFEEAQSTPRHTFLFFC